MARITTPLIVCAALALLCLPAWAAPPEPALVWRGDIATGRSLMQELSKAWQKAGHPAIKLESFSTISGIDAALAGSADIAGSARAAFPRRTQEAGLVFTPVAWDALVLIVHRGNPVRDISLNQLHDIYLGKIDNWNALGGPDQPIHLYSVASPLDGIEFSLRRYLFRRGNQPVASQRLYINTEQLEDAVAIDPLALGASTLSGVRGNKKLAMLSVGDVRPSLAHIEDGSYPLYQPLYLASAINETDQDAAHAFVQFVTGERGRAVLRANDVMPYDGTEPQARDLEQHLAAVQDESAPRANGPVAAPGATYASRAADAPTSERTLEARQRLADQREREAASAAARERNRQPTEAHAND